MTEINNISTIQPLQDVDIRDYNRFIQYVDKITSKEGCWLWLKSKTHDNYGLFWLNDKYETSHRVSYKFFRGDIPEGKFVLHTCDNPNCVNPYHLYIGTHQDNMKDRQNRNRQAQGEKHGSVTKPEKLSRGENHWTHTNPELTTKGSKNGSAKLNEDDVLELRTLFSTGQHSVTELAKKYNVTHNLISLIVHNKAWKHVNEVEAPTEVSKAKRRLEKYTDKTSSGTDCWLWLGGKTTNGCGVMWYKGSSKPINKIIYEIYYGEYPEKQVVIHTCNTTACVNPEHLKIK